MTGIAGKRRIRGGRLNGVEVPGPTNAPVLLKLLSLWYRDATEELTHRRWPWKPSMRICTALNGVAPHQYPALDLQQDTHLHE
ncbi:unnamed protein product [Clonostachys rosea]|uniref:Uncharacterized protein n=1 Tax=Bionectria ochroleuca TaxID=29856 RepID=A0ABY6TUK7_BIOOC|nr:unnamed protein product [Clonostachys rosea]